MVWVQVTHSVSWRPRHGLSPLDFMKLCSSVKRSKPSVSRTGSTTAVESLELSGSSCVAQWLRRWPCNPKVAGLNPCAVHSPDFQHEYKETDIIICCAEKK